jgi:hypothetical protein
MIATDIHGINYSLRLANYTHTPSQHADRGGAACKIQINKRAAVHYARAKDERLFLPAM